MSKRLDGEGGEAQRGKESEFSQHGGIFRKLNWWLLLYTHIHTHTHARTHTHTHTHTHTQSRQTDTNFPTLAWAHTCSKFLCCLGDRGEFKVPNKNACVSFKLKKTRAVCFAANSLHYPAADDRCSTFLSLRNLGAKHQNAHRDQSGNGLLSRAGVSFHLPTQSPPR